MVEYTSLKTNYDLYKKEYEEALRSVLDSGWYILGDRLQEFEKAFAEYLGVKYCIGLNSGTDALILAIRALGIGERNSDMGGSEDDEVIVPAGSYIASVLGITENGAKPVYVDSNSESMLMDVDLIEQAITERTRAILPVHLYGQVCNMDKIIHLSEKYKLDVIEDCAQCHGAKWGRSFAGALGDISCFSFYPTKPLGAFGDAGCICTNSDEIENKARLLRNYGSKEKYINEVMGRNSRLDELQAAFLSVGLKHLDENNERRINISKQYMQHIRNAKVRLPINKKEVFNVYHIFPVIVDDQEGFIKYMNDRGIKTQVHYPIPPYEAKCYRGTIAEGKSQDYPYASYFASHEVSLPIYSGMSQSDVESVIEAVNSY